MKTSFKRIAVIVAMGEEIAPLLSRLNAEKNADFFNAKLPMTVFHAKLKDTELLFSINGKVDSDSEKVALIGSVPAAINTLKVIEEFKPDLLISAGTAGGFKSRGAKIADIYLSREVRFHDRRITVPGFQEVAERAWPIHFIEDLQKKLNIKSGVVTTGDSFDMSKDDGVMMEKFQTDAKEMEAAAVATVADLLGVPFFALKSITDLVDHHESSAQDQFLKNLKLASEKLCEKLYEALNFLSQ